MNQKVKDVTGSIMDLALHFAHKNRFRILVYKVYVYSKCKLLWTFTTVTVVSEETAVV